MTPQSKKKKSLFGFFQKEIAPSSPLPAAPIEDPEEKEPAIAVYHYTSSWQKTKDDEVETREVVVNAQGVASKLEEILSAPEEEVARSEQEPRCLSELAAEKFAQALCPQQQAAEHTPPMPDVEPAPIAVAQPEPPVAAPVTGRFSDRLKQHVEGTLQQPSVPPAAPRPLNYTDVNG